MAKQRNLDCAYMECAFAMAKLSHAVRKKVGAILVSPHTGIIAEGVNGTYSGADNICETLDIPERWCSTEFEYYWISTFGRVKRLEHVRNHGKLYTQPVLYKETILPIKINKKGYATVKINGLSKTVHHLVGLTFIKNARPHTHNQINHIDRDKTNNHVSNLEWCTNRYNCCDRSHDLPHNTSLSQKGNMVEEDYITYKYLPTIDDYRTKSYVLHAESNAIAKVARSTNSSVDSTLYITLSPCLDCAKQIIQAGITRVVYAEEYRITTGIELLVEAGIQVDRLAIYGQEQDSRDLYLRDEGRIDYNNEHKMV